MKKKKYTPAKQCIFYPEFAPTVNTSITLSIDPEPIRPEGSRPRRLVEWVNTRYNYLMHLWDYREKDLKKTAWGRRHLLEHMINYGPGRRKISLKAVKENWDKLELDPLRRRLMRLLIWER